MKVEMKDSGIPWIGLVPYDWEVLPYKQVMKKTKNIKFDYQGEDIISLTMNGVVKRDLDNPKGKMPLTFDGYQIVQKGNLLLCLFDIDVTPRCVGLIQDDGLTSPAYSHFIMINNNSSVYYNYQLRYIDDIKAFLHLSKNIRSSLTETDFGIIRTIRPPFQLQQQIANFLDDKCADIDQLITLQQQMIDELKAYKQSVITEAVCKGLDKSVPMKDSGIEWIGEVPEGWEVIRLDKIGNFNKGLTITKENLQEEGIPCVNYGEIHSKFGFEVNPKINVLRCVSEDYITTSPNSILKYGDFVFADTSEDIDGSGNFTYLNSNDQTFAGYHTIIFKTTTQKIVSRYLAYLFNSKSYRAQIQSKVKGVKVFSISQGILKSTYILLPEIDEQNEIVSYLDQKSSQIDTLISIKQKKIDELKEYKKSMIYEYITGKKQVPN